MEEEEAKARTEMKKKCRECGALVSPMGTYAHVEHKHPELKEDWDEIKGEIFEDVEIEVEPPPPETPTVEEEGLKPAQVAAQDETIKYLEEELPKVYGFSETRADRVVKWLRNMPQILYSPNLYTWIRNFAGRNVNQEDLSLTITAALQKLGIPSGREVSMLAPQPPQPGQQILQVPQQQASLPLQAQTPRAQMPQIYPAQRGQIPTPPPPEEKKYPIVVDGQEIETSEKGLMAWKKFLTEKEDREERREERRDERKEKREESEKRVELPVGEKGETQEVPKALVPFYMQQRELARAEEIRAKSNEAIEKLKTSVEEEREKRHEAELERRDRQLRSLSGHIDRLREKTTPEAIRKAAEGMGYMRGESPTYNLLSDMQGHLETLTERLLERGMPSYPTGEGYPVGEVRYSQQSRRNKAGKLRKRIERADELLDVEREVVEAGRKLARERGKSSTTVEG